MEPQVLREAKGVIRMKLVLGGIKKIPQNVVPFHQSGKRVKEV